VKPQKIGIQDRSAVFKHQRTLRRCPFSNQPVSDQAGTPAPPDSARHVAPKPERASSTSWCVHQASPKKGGVYPRWAWLGRRFDNATIQRVLHEEPKFSELFISHLLARNARVEADLVDQLFNSSEKRLARLLLLMANFGKEGKPEPVIAKISQETLAEMIGTTRSRVSTFMNKFRRLGFIEYNGELKVHNSLLNVILYDAPELRRETEDA
jgi:Crp-like helix-turn-helix domain